MFAGESDEVLAKDTSYPGEERPLRHFPALTKRVTAGVDKLVRQGVPYLEAGRASDPAVQAWLEPLYAAGPRSGSVVAIVRTIEGVRSFSCRPRTHTRAKGDPTTGRRPTETAEHHLTRARHTIRVYYFYVFDAHWGRAGVRLSSYLPFEITLLHEFRSAIAADPIAESLHSLLITLGIARPRPLAA
jgi:hypothetical protein